MKVSVDTICRTVLLIIALINAGLEMTGHSIIPIDDETVTQIISLLFAVVASLVAWWKNNSFTNNAIIADAFLKELKDTDEKYEGEE